jgi:hypothetical protein
MGAAVAAAGAVGTIGTGVNSLVHSLETLFGGASTGDAKARVDGWVTQIEADLRNLNTRGTATHAAWVDLRCGAGDQSVLAEYRALGVDPTAKSCGYGTQAGIDYAKAAVAVVQQAYNSLGPNQTIGGSNPVIALPSGVPPTIGGISTPLIIVGLIVAWLVFGRKS